MFVSIGKAALYYGVSVSTMRRWDNASQLKSLFRTLGGHRRYQLNQIAEHTEKLDNLQVIAYARVSGSKQRKELENQVQAIKNYVKNQNWQLLKIYRDIGSGMNEERKNFQKMLQDLPIYRPYAIISTYSDRLARFGIRVIQSYCHAFSSKLIHINMKKKKSVEEGLVEDMIALVTSFAGKLHRRRRGKVLTN